MKNVLFILCLLIAGNTSIHAQTPIDRQRQPAKPLEVLPIINIAETTTGILGILKSKLALSDAQGPKISGLITEFLKSKSGILPLAKSNPANYTSKFEPIKNKLLDGLKSEFTSAQYTKFLGLKPKASETDNLLSHLFF